jgi:hypothetical protein
MTKGSDNVFPRLLISEGGSTSTPAANRVTVYAKSDGLLYSKDDAGAETALGAGSGISDQGEFTYLDAEEDDAPGTPASGFVRIYAKADGRVYSKDDGGVEYGPFDAAGAGGAALYIDQTALHADGDEFDDTGLTGWTVTGTSVAAVDTEVYDDTCLDITFGTHKDRLLKAKPSSSDFEISVTVYGFNNSADNHLSACQGAMGPCFVDDSGNGVCFVIYNDSHLRIWTLSAYAISASTDVFTLSSTYIADGASAAGRSGLAAVLKLKKVGTTITGSFSYNGGSTYYTGTRSDSTTFTKVGILRAGSGGGTSPLMRVGRFNVTEL